VTTGEIWNIWRDNPELASSVDFIAAHSLPYWENFTDSRRWIRRSISTDAAEPNFPASGS